MSPLPDVKTNGNWVSSNWWDWSNWVEPPRPEEREPDWWDKWYEGLLDTLRQKFERPDIPTPPSIDPWSELYTAIPGVREQYPQNLWAMFTETARGTSDQPWRTGDYMTQIKDLITKPTADYDAFMNDPKWSGLSQPSPEEKARRSICGQIMDGVCGN